MCTKPDKENLRQAFDFVAGHDDDAATISQAEWAGFVDMAWNFVDADSNGKVDGCELEKALKTVLG